MLKEDVKENDDLAQELITRTEQLIENAEPSPDRDNLEQKLQDIKARWGAVKAKTSDRDVEITNHAPGLHNYYTHVDPFTDWLTSIDKKLSNQEPVSCDSRAIDRQVEQAKKLKHQLDNHVPEYEKLKVLAADVIESQPDDVYVVEAQIQYLNKLWDSVSLRLNDRVRQTITVKELVEQYEDTILPVHELFTRAEDGIAPLETVGCDVDKAKRELSNTKVSNLVRHGR
jgi:archaellum component FlaC